MFKLVFIYTAIVIAVAIAQGLCMPALKRTAPGREADLQSFALHYLLVAAYFLPLLNNLDLSEAFIAVAVRFTLFDFTLNATEGNDYFAVGNTALSDRFQQWIAARIGKPALYVNAVGKMLGIGAILWFLHRFA